MLSRRRFICGSTGLAVVAGLPGLALARGEGDARLVLVILRGGLDGLAAVAPYGESRYRALRGALAIDAPGSDDGRLLKLDGLFALHPALSVMHELFRAGELTLVHAVATPYRERSHFDGQNVLESGAAFAHGLRDGWLNRAVAGFADADESGGAIALSQNIPLVLRGRAAVTSWAPSRLPDATDDTLARIAAMYADDAHLTARLQEALEARSLAGEMGADAPRRGRGAGQLQPLVRAAGRFLSADEGPRIAVLESGGWDTHANQGGAQGLLANRLRDLDQGLGALKNALGSHWKSTTAIIATEFGRTVAINGTRGTDHGTAGCVFVAGGAVDGGRVVSDWPGLGARELYEGRDLRPTLDIRSVFKGVLIDHMDIDAARLDDEIFPDSGTAAPLEGLVRRA